MEPLFSPAAPRQITVDGDLLRAPGTATLAALDAALLRAGRWLPLDGPSDGELGLLITRDSAGPLRARYGGWEHHLTRILLEGPRGQQLELTGDDVPLAVASRGTLGTVLAFEARTLPRPEMALAVRFSSPISTASTSTAPQPAWTFTARSATWAAWLGTEADIAAADAAITQRPASVLRQSLAEDERLRTRLWRWPEGIEGERIRLHVRPDMLRTTLLEGIVLASVAEPTTGLVLATVPARNIPRLAEVTARHGGWLERTEREPTPDELLSRWGPARAARFEELRQRLAVPR